MRLTIIGAGAIGGTIGAHMIRAGHDVLFCDTDQAHVAAINRSGLTIEGPVASFTVRARAVTPAGLPDRLERVAIATKSHHTREAVEPLRRRLSAGGYLVSFQNGLTGPELAGVVGWERLLLCLVNFGADYRAPGRILQGNVGTFKVGESRIPEVTPRVQELAEALPYAEPAANIMGYIWAKEAYGAMLYAGAVSDLAIADTLEDARWRPLMLGIAREVLAQSPVPPEPFDGFDPQDLEGSLARLAQFNRGSAKSHSGIYRDLMVRRRKTEVDDLLRDLKGPLTTYTGELIHAIERGERTCDVANLELLAACERAERLGRPVHALVQVIPAPPRARSGPLLGLQIAVKDLIDVAGQPRGNGNPRDMAGKAAERDAPLVARLRVLGADVFATAALLEYAAGALHPDIPETRNPLDPRRTAGGSSGGSAALVGAGVCSLAVGTDTGGSIRIPAAYCGVVGLKPTYGRLPKEGAEPLAPSLDHLGLIAADTSLLARAWTALSGDREVRPPNRPHLGVLASSFRDPMLADEVSSGLEAALGQLESGGCRLRPVAAGVLDQLRQVYDDVILFEAWEAHRDRVEADPSRYGPDTLRLLLSGSRVRRARRDSALRLRDRLLPEAEALHQGFDALLCPVVPFCAPTTTPPIDTPQGDQEGHFTKVFNLTGQPALSLPCGSSPDGLPIGLQLISPRNRDAALLAVASRVEAILAVPARQAAPA
ncbi:MAG: amidase family protein [Candidatus Dormibacteria bacterium]